VPRAATAAVPALRGECGFAQPAPGTAHLAAAKRQLTRGLPWAGVMGIRGQQVQIQEERSSVFALTVIDKGERGFPVGRKACEWLSSLLGA